MSNRNGEVEKRISSLQKSCLLQSGHNQVTAFVQRVDSGEQTSRNLEVCKLLLIGLGRALTGRPFLDSEGGMFAPQTRFFNLLYGRQFSYDGIAASTMYIIAHSYY